MIIKWFIISTLIFSISRLLYRQGLKMAITEKDDNYKLAAEKYFSSIMLLSFLSMIISCIAAIIHYL